MAQVLLKTPLMASSSQSPLGSWRSIITCGRGHGEGGGGEGEEREVWDAVLRIVF